MLHPMIEIAMAPMKKPRRPPVTVPRSVSIFLRLPTDLAAEIDAISEADFRPRTKTIELALRQFVQERKRSGKPAS
jgi:hypothetical protein